MCSLTYNNYKNPSRRNRGMVSAQERILCEINSNLLKCSGGVVADIKTAA